jgi:mannose-6-phosphate isomerase class I
LLTAKERMSHLSQYDRFPSIKEPAAGAWQGWSDILDVLRGEISRGARRIAVECYPGVYEDDVARAIVEGLAPCRVLRTADRWKAPCEIDAMVARDLTSDPVFGRISGFVIEDFADPQRLACAREQLDAARRGVTVILGTGTALLDDAPEVLVYADMARWEIQQRQRAGKSGNLAAANSGERPSLLYKRGYFLDWRVADRIKKKLLPRCDYLLDTNDAAAPKLVTGDTFRAALRHAATRPFRVVPFFDPGPWGGQWMRRVCGLEDGPPNYAWCFDCVPEENSLLFDFGGVRVEAPAIDLVFLHPRELLGDAVHGRFGTEFPIRFDFLDTMDGGNLSLQVHPLTEYIQDKFGMAYTQDESYYMLDAAPDACVYLGLREGVDRAAMIAGLRRAQEGGTAFDAETYVNRWPARKHDHFLIPAGTIHCSGRNSMVLEISATPYIFTFKLWDWGRLGLDGRPRPIHLDHGIANIQWDRDTAWVKENLVGHVERIAEGAGWREERTGLHEREFIETRRHWFTSAVPHHTRGGVHVLNLVEGEEAVVESPAGAFEPFVVHYAETFIVPAAVGAYTIRPTGPGQCGTVCASVRTRP